MSPFEIFKELVLLTLALAELASLKPFFLAMGNIFFGLLEIKKKHYMLILALQN